MSRADLDAVLGLALTDEQWQCVSAPLEPFVIVAGAGTGKTLVMAARVLWLVASALVAEHEVLGLTFTNKAAAELGHRISALLGRWRTGRPTERDEVAGEPTIATYHSFAGRLIEEQGLRVGIEPGARLLSPAVVAQLAHRVVCDSDRLTATRHVPSRVAHDVMALDANLAEQTITTAELREHDRAVIAEIDALPRPTKAIQEIRETAARRIELAHLVDALRAEKDRVGGLDFSDHMRLCVDLVRGSEELVTTMRASYRVVLLDEYQDTSIAQRVLLSTLFAGTAVTAVGDPLQAIYGWRSASVANIAAFGAHFGRKLVTPGQSSAKPGDPSGPPGSVGSAPVRVLSVNRRSGDPILAAANAAARDLRSAHPEVAPLRSPEPRGADVRVALLPTIADEREWIADQVAGLVAEGHAPESIAVLTRANDSLGPLRDALVSRGVPASISGAAALAASPYAMSVLATLRVLDDPADNVASVTLLAGPRWRIGPTDLEALGRRSEVLAGPPSGRRGRPPGSPGRPGAEGDPGGLRQRLSEVSAQPDPVERASLLEAAADPGPQVSLGARARLSEFVEEIRQLQALVGSPLPELTARVVQVTGAQVEADLHAARTPGAVSAAQAGDVGLAGLLHLVDGFSDAEGRSGLGAFLAYLDTAEQFGPGEQVELPVVPGSVQLMTMHKAKGLQFPVVVLPHLAKDVFPGRSGGERWTTQAHVVPSELRDDRHVLPALTGFSTAELNDFRADCRTHDRSGDDRLAYVAITRAQEVLIASGHWWGPSQKGRRGPSPYLEALRATAAESAQQLFLVGYPWADEPECDEDGDAPTNPMLDQVHEAPWPPPDPSTSDPVVRAACAVQALVDAGVPDPWAAGALDSLSALADVRPPPGAPAAPGRGDPATALPAADALDPRVAQQIGEWDAAITALLARTHEGTDGERTVAAPGVLSASAAMELLADPETYAERLLRPMPRRRNRHADLGTAFHAWVEARLGVQPLIADDELPGAADEGIESAEDLAVLTEAFERLPYAQRQPAGLEVPFGLVVGGRLLTGRIDAVFPAGPEAPEGVLWEVVDWKTSRHDQADPLQLAIYRLAWADRVGVPVESVGAAFAFVRSGRVVRPGSLPRAEALAAVLGGVAGGAVVEEPTGAAGAAEGSAGGRAEGLGEGVGPVG